MKTRKIFPLLVAVAAVAAVSAGTAGAAPLPVGQPVPAPQRNDDAQRYRLLVQCSDGRQYGGESTAPPGDLSGVQEHCPSGTTATGWSWQTD
ncbi:hypothetical protein CUT44_01890 [Streptomyces carminius]|uniref:Secreted protein n=1 Tax=Streptomyces carminius TaxID=2665496 RepID=A0A2M8M1E2_9ACTN|nr:hypothetical protein [Streptomyces carminius]PJE98018.1 hypothetical protein CUT44_10150 [Streptomyces carminius]PJF01844.1 hypothetical protein CUT44_01890 [Streptomyces carminius]